MTERILVGYDGSQNSEAALDAAIDEAEARGAELDVITRVAGAVLGRPLFDPCRDDPHRARGRGFRRSRRPPGRAPARSTRWATDRARITEGGPHRRGVALRPRDRRGEGLPRDTRTPARFGDTPPRAELRGRRCSSSPRPASSISPNRTNNGIPPIGWPRSAEARRSPARLCSISIFRIGLASVPQWNMGAVSVWSKLADLGEQHAFSLARWGSRL